MRSGYSIVPCMEDQWQDWLILRIALWPHCSMREHQKEMRMLLDHPQRYAQFLACDHAQNAVGLLELALRQDYVNGTTSSPVSFIEGIYVLPNQRRRGIAAALMAKATEWACSKGCCELASDALIDNKISHKMHKALGFEETERVVFFRKILQ